MDVPASPSVPPPIKFLDRVRAAVRLQHGERHPGELGAAEVTEFLTQLAVERGVSAATQNQARSALLFLYKAVLEMKLPWLDEVVTAKRGERLAVVLTPREVRAVLQHLSAPPGLVCALLYGTGMRLLEALRLRVKDVEFSRREIVVREGKGNKDRVTVLPETLIKPLQSQLERARKLREQANVPAAEKAAGLWGRRSCGVRSAKDKPP
jgi:site-specific recombinase XerD